MSLEHIIAVDARGSRLRPCMDERVESRIVQKLLPKICRSFVRLDQELQGTYFLFSRKGAYQFPITVRHMFERYILIFTL